MQKPLLARERMSFFIYRYRKYAVKNREQRQRLIDTFLNTIYLYEDKCVLTFHDKDGTKIRRRLRVRIYHGEMRG